MPSAFGTDADIHFGDVDAKAIDWRIEAAPDPDPDDELLDPSPADVVVVLGFDPLELVYEIDDGEPAGDAQLAKN